MASARQLVEFKGAVQSVHTSPPSVPPRGRSLTPSPSPKGEGSRMKSEAWRVKRCQELLQKIIGDDYIKERDF